MKKYELMKTETPSWKQESAAEEILQRYSKKVRNGKRLRRLLVVLLALSCLLMGGLTALTVHRMYSQNNPVVHEVEGGVWNLTAGELSVAAEEAPNYALFTNYTQIQVDVVNTESSESVKGTVYLYNAAYSDPILQFELTDEKQNGCFTGLSSAYRYRVEVVCEHAAQVTISEGRETDFFSCFGMVVTELFTALMS